MWQGMLVVGGCSKATHRGKLSWRLVQSVRVIAIVAQAGAAQEARQELQHQVQRLNQRPDLTLDDRSAADGVRVKGIPDASTMQVILRKYRRRRALARIFSVSVTLQMFK